MKRGKHLSAVLLALSGSQLYVCESFARQVFAISLAK